MVDRETDRLHALRSRPVLATPDTMVAARSEDITRLQRRSHAAVSTAVVRALDQVHHLRAQVRALSPQKTLDRGYAVVQLDDGKTVPGTRHEVVRDPSQAPAGAELTVRVAGGRFTAQSTGGHVPAGR